MEDARLRQDRIRRRLQHPSGSFVPLPNDATDRSLPDLFREQVRRHGDRPAVRGPDGALTYAELDERSSAIARAVPTPRGPDPEPVALLLANDAAMIAALLGVWKAGRIAVPLDPTYPPERLETMVRDAGASLVVTDPASLPRGDGLAELPPVPPDAPSYILYTSGSTGLPKGVFQTHRGQIRDAGNYANGMGICPHDRLMLLTAYTQLGMQLISSALVTGACLFPVDLAALGGRGLADWLVRERITIFRSTTTFFRRFARSLEDGARFPELRVVRLGGEPVLPSDHELFRARFRPPCVLCNALATTETGAISVYLVDHGTEPRDDCVPVGFPVDGCEVLVLDGDGAPVAAGQAGELVVRSRFLSPGYWRRPDLTAQRYRTEPDGATRLYFTGDFGRREPDGCLVHLGRRDGFVKVRGFLVSLGEVESALLSHEGVREAVVAAVATDGGDVTLAAYAVAASGARPTASALRRSLERRLPGPMIPSSFTFLDALPVTPNGKVDRGALPPPPRARPDLDVAYVAPRDGTEALLAELWSAVLGCDPVGVDDPFLDLGGDSLRAMQLASTIADLLRTDVTIADLLEAGTVSGLAARITRSADARPDAASGARLSEGQLAVCLAQRARPDVPLYNTACAVALDGAVDPGRFERAFLAVLDSCEVLRTVIRDEDGSPRGHVVLAPPDVLSFVDFAGEPDAATSARTWIRERAARPLSPERGPLESALLRVAGHRFLWYLNQHAIVSDAASTALLIRRASDLYEDPNRIGALLGDDAPPFDEHVERERREGRSPARHSADVYWRGRLERLPEPLILRGRSTAPGRETRVLRLSRTLSAERTAEIRAFAAAADPPAMGDIPLLAVFLAAVSGYLHAASGASRFWIGTPVHNRTTSRMRKIVGPVMDVVPVEMTVTSADTFASLAARARHGIYESLRHAPCRIGRKPYDVAVNLCLETLPRRLFGAPATFERIHSGHELEALSVHVHDVHATGRFTVDVELRQDVFPPERCEAEVDALLGELERGPGDARRGSAP